MFWAETVTPEVADAPTTKASNRKSNPDEIRNVSSRLQDELSARWPSLTVADRIRRFANDIGWTVTRSKDVYYADPRVSLRAFEQAEINAWFNRQQKGRNA
jgi:hypothetical protein